MVKVGTACNRLAVVMSGMIGGGFSELADAVCEAVSDVPMANGVTRADCMNFLRFLEVEYFDFEMWSVFLSLSLLSLAEDDSWRVDFCDDVRSVVVAVVGPLRDVFFESGPGEANDSTSTGKEVSASAEATRSSERESIVVV